MNSVTDKVLISEQNRQLTKCLPHRVYTLMKETPNQHTCHNMSCDDKGWGRLWVEGGGRRSRDVTQDRQRRLLLRWHLGRDLKEVRVMLTELKGNAKILGWADAGCVGGTVRSPVCLQRSSWGGGQGGGTGVGQKGCGQCRPWVGLLRQSSVQQLFPTLAEHWNLLRSLENCGCLSLTFWDGSWVWPGHWKFRKKFPRWL